MNKKQTIAFAMVAMVFGVMTSPIITADDAFALYRPDPRTVIQGELTTPNDNKPFGGKNIGDFTVSIYDDRKSNSIFNDKTRISVTVEDIPSPGTVYEGWLVDVDSGKKSSFGIFESNTQRHASSIHKTVENNFEYDLIVITEEPQNDTNPAPDTPIAGAVLGEDFKQ